MAENKTVVLDVSSDDDAGWRDGLAACGFDDDGGVGCRDDGDWISEVLDELDKEKDDSDDVVVVGEVLVKSKLRVSKTLVKCAINVDDDDCVVLDGDPDKPISIQNDKEGDDDSDDLLVVSEKGQVACRDFPHARHLCVKFPFNYTPHERHCDQCHCYVCDSLAPCGHWNSGISTIDHCHATDKDEFWENQRKSARKGNGSLPVVSGVPETSFPVGQSPPCQISSSLPSEYSQRYCLPNNVICATTQQPEYDWGDKFLPHWVSHRSQNTRNNVTRGDRRHIAINAGSQVISRIPFRRRARTPGVFPIDQSVNNASRSSYNNQLFRRNPPPGMVGARWVDRGGGNPVLSTYKDSSRANIGGTATNLIPNISAQTIMGTGTANYTPSQPQIIPRAHGSSVNRNADGPQHQVSPGIFVGGNFTSPMPMQPAVGAEPNFHCTFDNPFPFPSQATPCQGGASISQNSGPSHSLGTTILSNMSFPAQPNGSSGFKNSSPHRSQACKLAPSPLNAGENVLVQGYPTQSARHSSSTDLYQSEGCSLAAALLNAGENVSAAGDRSQSVMLSSSTDFDFNLDFHRSHSDQPLPVNQLQNAVQRDEPAVPLDGNSELPVCIDPSPSALEFDPWLFENESGLDAFGNPEPNVFCPEATTLDAGFFDFSIL